MYQKFNKFIFFGMVFTLVFGTLLHFFYDWSGSNPIVGLFAPINESVWEHLKLLYYPMSIWIIGGFFRYGRKNKNYFVSAIAGFLCGAVSIPLLFYFYHLFTPQDILALDIAIFILATCISFLVMGYFYKNYNFRFLSVKQGIFIWELFFALFAFFTIFPPNLGIFQA